MPEELGPWQKYGTASGEAVGPWTKYAQPAGAVAVAAPATATVPSAPSYRDRAVSMLGDAAGDLVDFLPNLETGALKGAGSTAYNLADAADRGIRAIPGMQNLVPEIPPKPDALEPHGIAQGLGHFGEQVGEFFLPEVAGLGKVTTGLEDLVPAVKWAVKPAMEALSAGGVTAAQGGNPRDVALGAGIAGGATALAKPAAELLGKGARRIEESAVKAPLSTYGSMGAAAQGSKTPLADAIFKNNLGGTLGRTYEKAHAMLQDLSSQLASKLQNNPATVDVLQALADTEQDLLGSTGAKARNAGQLPGIQKALDDWADNIQQVSPSGDLDLLNANNLKRSTKLRADFWYGHSDPNASANELVATKLYSKLKDAIERASSDPEIRALNQKMSEVIPVQSAVLRRIPIAERSDIISLTDAVLGLPAAMSGHVSALALPAARWASKSPQVANVLQKTTPETVTTAGKLAVGMASPKGQRKFFITAMDKQMLGRLGYSQDDIESMSPAEAGEIMFGKVPKPQIATDQRVNSPLQ